MQKEIITTKTINNEEVIQITTLDERWYIKQEGLYVPSSTWIASFYPKGINYMKWLASKGWDEAEAIKIAAGNKGSKIHQAVYALLQGEEVKMSSEFYNEKGQLEELVPEEYHALMTFADWFHQLKPKVIFNEQVVFGKINKEDKEDKEDEDYAGTIDLLCEIDGVKWLIDIKTGQYIWPEHELQLSSYFHALGIEGNMAFLQLGYKRNKAGWKLTPCKDKFHLFKAAYQIWKNECANISPLQRDYPTSIKLNFEDNEDTKTAKK